MADGENGGVNAGAVGDERMCAAVDERVRNAVHERLREDVDFLLDMWSVYMQLCKVVAESNTLNQLMQLLIGLDDPYDHIRSQILAIEPLPSVNKAFAMVERVEKQRKLNSMSTEPKEGVALIVRWLGPWGRDQKPKAVKRRDMVDKGSQFCTHCDKSRHTREM
ncbi:hypothetical protein Sango_2325600 [Sesamum angolense]|uniref:Uncharacterized protein n=1 Tax=Sesamum angolense TaxID=2727404 RepID=A0AAE2BLK5_9LAMI|nr:hypothetical protein Sango_2325600 [Sesamum angolense]